MMQNVGKPGVKKLTEEGDLLQALAKNRRGARQVQVGAQRILPDAQRFSAFTSDAQYRQQTPDESLEGVARFVEVWLIHLYFVLLIPVLFNTCAL